MTPPSGPQRGRSGAVPSALSSRAGGLCLLLALAAVAMVALLRAEQAVVQQSRLQRLQQVRAQAGCAPWAPRGSSDPIPNLDSGPPRVPQQGHRRSEVVRGGAGSGTDSASGCAHLTPQTFSDDDDDPAVPLAGRAGSSGSGSAGGSGSGSAEGSGRGSAEGSTDSTAAGSDHWGRAANRPLGSAAAASMAVADASTKDDGRGTGHGNTNGSSVGEGILGKQVSKDDELGVQVPVHWFAPFLDHSSFGGEAAGLVLGGLLRGGVVRADQLHIGLLQDRCEDQLLAGPSGPAGPGGGGSNSSEAEADHDQLLTLRSLPTSPAIVVCHNLPPYLGRPAPRWASCEPCPPPGRPTRWAVARAMAETDRIPASFVAALNSMDEVWVPAPASARALRDSGVRVPLTELPPAVDAAGELDPGMVVPLQLPPPGCVQVFGPPGRPPRRPYVFVSVFKWEARKGHDVLLAAFLRQFSAAAGGAGAGAGAAAGAAATADDDDADEDANRDGVGDGVARKLGDAGGGAGAGAARGPGVGVGAAAAAGEGLEGDGDVGEWGEGGVAGGVELYIVTKPFLQPSSDMPIADAVRAWAQAALGPQADGTLDALRSPRVYLLSGHLPRQRYVRLLAAADAFVLPTRGEGWGLPIMEAMALGLPVIATNWSGPTAYLDETVGYPLSYQLSPVPPREPWWFQGSRWAEPSESHLRLLMAHVSGSEAGRRGAMARGAAARRRVLERYSMAAAAGRLSQTLRRIEAATAPAATRDVMRVGEGNGSLR